MGHRPQKLELTWFNKDQALIPTEDGKYGYTWVDPKDPRHCETHALVVEDIVRGEQSPKNERVAYSERADLEPTEDNLLILGESGDVLEALTRVPELAGRYVGQVKCVYIDPPFNTAQTFANYEDNLEHSIWLTMMRDRLVHLRQLLSDDGSIWVHLDNVENHRMRVLLDEVFGAGNFVAEVIWEKADGPRNNSNSFSTDHDTITVYRKSDAFPLNRLPRTEADNDRFSNPDNDPVGLWWDGDPTARHSVSAKQHPGVYGIQHPITGKMMYPGNSANWYYGQNEVLRIMRGWGSYELGEISPQELDARRRIEGPGVELRHDVKPLVIPGWNSKDADIARVRYEQGEWPEFILRGGGEGGIGMKTYIPQRGNVPRTLWRNKDVGHNRSAKKEIAKLFPDRPPFTTPKPERLLERIIHIATSPGDVVLDVFAGSGTSAAVAHKMGRRWVTCELVKSTFDRYTRPRLEKVLYGEDKGGISLTQGGRLDATSDGLPEGLSVEDAHELTSLLNKAIADRVDLKKNPTVKELKALVKTRKSKDSVNWRGGGSFKVASLSPTCFDYDQDLDLTTLTEAATGLTLVESVAANLRFYRTPEDRHFDGLVGRQYLAVVEGVLDNDKVDDLMAHLPAGHTLLIAATIIPEGIRDYARGFRNGSRVVHIPLDIFTYTKAQEGN